MEQAIRKTGYEINPIRGSVSDCVQAYKCT